MCHLKGDRGLPKNIDLFLSLLCAVESWNMSYATLSWHIIDENNILINSRHAFRAKRSCESQLLSTVDSPAISLDKHNQTVLILDISKAFYTVPPQRRTQLQTFYIDITGLLQSNAYTKWSPHQSKHLVGARLSSWQVHGEQTPVLRKIILTVAFSEIIPEIPG